MDAAVIPLVVAVRVAVLHGSISRCSTESGSISASTPLMLPGNISKSGVCGVPPTDDIIAAAFAFPAGGPLWAVVSSAAAETPLAITECFEASFAMGGRQGGIFIYGVHMLMVFLRSIFLTLVALISLFPCHDLPLMEGSRLNGLPVKCAVGGFHLLIIILVHIIRTGKRVFGCPSRGCNSGQTRLRVGV